MEENLRKQDGSGQKPPEGGPSASGDRRAYGAATEGAPEASGLESGISAGYLPRLTAAEARALAPLTLAFIGDAAYELCNRTRLVQEADRNPKELQRRASAFARAPFQSAAMEVLEPLLTEEEAEVYHRGRNAKSQTKAKNASIQDYRRATGFEAVLGYLYLSGNLKRVLELVRIANEHTLPA